jgi:nitroreductase
VTTLAHVTAAHLRGAVAAAVQAPSVHNTQPWLFRITDDAIEVHADWRRQLIVSDPTGRAVRMSCGAAVLNARLALRRMGFTVEVDVKPDHDGALAHILVTGLSPPTPTEIALYDAIPRRHSNRFPFLDTDVSASERTALMRAAEVEGAWLSLVIGQVALDVVVSMAHLADRTLGADQAYQAELAQWSRTDPASADGVPRLAGGPAPEPHDLLIGRDFGGARRAPGHDFEPDPFIAVLGAYVDTPTAELNAGQALQRVLLTATELGLTASLASQPIDVPAVREQLRIGLRRYGPPQMLLRLGRGPTGPVTGRRPVEEVLLAPTEPGPAS